MAARWVGQKAESERRPYGGIVANSTALLNFKRSRPEALTDI